ncbi:capsule biosynthesis GfcC family protein [Vibrio anguillarum]|uniref:Uncharacterized protein n=18 Tax=Vibrio anguillarum TaxID=55601 RepID=A0A1Q1L3X8_VIBAN|nr:MULTISPECIES: capsule biosynthesis GfcC family protein [Vibrio]AQM18550.1 hypothetical protein PN51_01755 [Vibrio anguillarum]AQP37216.1 hypothetical protein AA909_01710 [Vibrio anguillarum]ASG08517.1 hypothetical protein CEQ50_13430 [Vibrio anguillarum]ASW82176.1 hypothetical protein CK207_14175 [Vibrio anguillarum]ATC58693.1 hypothetical protein CMV05_14340 [Vibrio anguillarum]
MAAFSASGFASVLTIHLPDEKKVLEYSQPERLEKIFTDIINQQKTVEMAYNNPNGPLAALTTYPLNNMLFNQDKASEVEKIKQTLLQRLTAYTHDHPKSKASIALLNEQISRWNVGYREFINLDYDVIRIAPKNNPQLEGNFEIITPKRPKTVRIEGLLFSPVTKPFIGGLTVADYLNQTTLLSSANNSNVWVIYPDGHAKQAGYAYWNDEQTLLAPGSVIFVGFNSSNAQLLGFESEIVSLLRSRKGFL